MIEPFYFLLLAFLMFCINIRTFSKPFAKWLTYVVMWLAIIASVVMFFYNWKNGKL